MFSQNNFLFNAILNLVLMFTPFIHSPSSMRMVILTTKCTQHLCYHDYFFSTQVPSVAAIHKEVSSLRKTDIKEKSAPFSLIFLA